MTQETYLDTRGLKCPLPVLKLRKRMKDLSPGAEIRLETDDPAAIVDVPHFCAEQGHEYLGVQSTETQSDVHRLRKGQL